MKSVINILNILFVLASFTLNGQNPAKQIREGNKAYDQGSFSDAEIFYRRAMEPENPWEKQAIFNMGNALYKQHKYQESAELYNQLAANESLSKTELSEVYHNLGNAYLMQKQYKESIDAYKNALRIKPDNEDTRYNLSYAMKMLQQQQNQNQDNKDNQENKDQKENKDKKDNKDQKDNKNQKDNQDNKDQQDKKDNKDKNNKQQPQMSRQDMERMLKAISGKDKETLDQLREQKIEKGNYSPVKDW